MKELVSFEVKARFAAFRKPYTTTSSLTYDFPPRTAMIGLISAVMGFKNGNGKAEYVKNFGKDFKIALEILNPVSKKRMVFKNLNTKKSAPSPNILTITEVLVNPHYKIYLSWEHEKIKKLKSLLSKGESFYTPYLGSANYIAEIKPAGIYKARWINPPEKAVVKSVVPNKNSLFFIPLDSQKYIFDTLPYELDAERSFISNREYVYNPDVYGVKVKVNEEKVLFKIDDEKVLTFM